MFLTGQEEIEATCKILSQKLPSIGDVKIIPFYAQRRQYETNDIFKKEKVRILHLTWFNFSL